MDMEPAGGVEITQEMLMDMIVSETATDASRLMAVAFMLIDQGAKLTEIYERVIPLIDALETMAKNPMLRSMMGSMPNLAIPGKNGK